MEYTNAYNDLSGILKKKRALEHSMSLIQWDLETEAPKLAIAKASEVLGILSGDVYALATSPEMDNYLKTLEKNLNELNEIEKKVVTECRKEYLKLVKIPKNEYEEYSILVAKAQSVWEESKKSNDFSLFKPYLEKLIETNKRFINYRGFDEHPYDTLLDDYEPGMTVKKLDEFFGVLKSEIVPLLKKIQDSRVIIESSFLNLDYDMEKQKEFSKFLAEYIGFDFNRGILKESVHPFTLNFDKNDVRITTHYAKKNILASIYSTIHEGGHAIYEQGIGEDLYNTILGSGVSMGVHESQSRFYENLVGRSQEFWKPIYGKLVELFPDNLKDIDLNSFFKAINRVENSLIRIEADELTYSLHIMIRYEMEKDIFQNDIDIDELPELWNKKVKNYLGIDVKNNSEGILQDVHWSAGLFGYFPSYALGNAYASQIFDTMKNDLDVELNLENGELHKIKAYLNENLHRFGKLKDPNELIKNFSGEELNAKHFTDYLKRKFSEIYGL